MPAKSGADEAARDAFRALNGDTRPRPPVTKYAALEAARAARDPRDLTAPVDLPAAAPAPWKRSVYSWRSAPQPQPEASRQRVVSDDGLRFEHVGTTGARLNRGRLKAMKVKTALRSGGIYVQNHSRRALKVRSAVRAGGIDPGGNHTRNLCR